MKRREKTQKIQEWILTNSNMHLCQCGCNQFISIQRHHYFRGVPRFIVGHSAKISNPMKGRIGNLNPNFHNGKYISPNGYILILVPGPGRSIYKQEHRLVMEQHLGRKLKQNEIVHHKNKIKTDNRIENLELMTNSEHTKLHMKNGDFQQHRNPDNGQYVSNTCRQ